jgi:hypothetical protein
MRQLCAQVICAGAILAGVYGMAVFGRPSDAPNAKPEDAPRSAAWLSLGKEKDPLAELYSMPAYVELQESLAHLQAMRSQLMQATAAGEGEDVAAAKEYRNSVRRFQAALGQVQERVHPKELSQILRNLCGRTPMTALATFAMTPVYPWELGDYIREMTP